MLGVVVLVYLHLLALKHGDTRVIGLNVDDEVVELTYRSFSKPRTVLVFIIAVVQGSLEGSNCLRT